MSKTKVPAVLLSKQRLDNEFKLISHGIEEVDIWQSFDSAE